MMVQVFGKSNLNDMVCRFEVIDYIFFIMCVYVDSIQWKKHMLLLK